MKQPFSAAASHEPRLPGINDSTSGYGQAVPRRYWSLTSIWLGMAMAAWTL